MKRIGVTVGVAALVLGLLIPGRSACAEDAPIGKPAVFMGIFNPPHFVFDTKCRLRSDINSFEPSLRQIQGAASELILEFIE